MTEQAHSGERYPPAPPARPSVRIGAPPSETTTLARPRVVRVSYGLWLAACLLGVITAAATLNYFDQLQADLLSLVEQEFPNEAPAKRDEVATAAVAILIGAGVLIFVVQTAFAVAMHSGRGWTRYPLVLFTFAGVAYNIVVVGAVPTVTQVGLPASTALMVIAMVLMFVPPTQAWFTQRHLARSGGYTSGE